MPRDEDDYFGHAMDGWQQGQAIGKPVGQLFGWIFLLFMLLIVDGFTFLPATI